MSYQQQVPMQAQYAQPNMETEWQNNLCNCSPCDSCLLGTFLPCILLGKTSERQRDPSLQTYEAMNSDCMVMTGISCLTGCGWM